MVDLPPTPADFEHENKIDAIINNFLIFSNSYVNYKLSQY